MSRRERQNSYPQQNLFQREYEGRHVRRETLAKYIYNHWVNLMLEDGHGDEVYVWDSWPWDNELFIEAVSVWVGELVVEPMIRDIQAAANHTRRRTGV